MATPEILQSYKNIFKKKDSGFKTILEVIQNDANEASKKDIYTELIKVEDNVLNTLNRLAETSENAKTNQLSLNMSIIEFITLFINNWKNIYREIFLDKQYNSFVHIFTSGDRKIFVGSMFILIALTLLMTFLS